MKLITKELQERFREVGDQSEFDNPLIITKFYSINADITWYPINYDQHSHVCYGYIIGGAKGAEFNSFSVSRLENRKKLYKLDLKRDIHFKEITFNELIQKNRITELKENTLEKDIDQELEQ